MQASHPPLDQTRPRPPMASALARQACLLAIHTCIRVAAQPLCPHSMLLQGSSCVAAGWVGDSLATISSGMWLKWGHSADLQCVQVFQMLLPLFLIAIMGLSVAPVAAIHSGWAKYHHSYVPSTFAVHMLLPSGHWSLDTLALGHTCRSANQL